MIELNNLFPNPGSIKNKKRKGRGQGTGKGGTSTKGHKGDKSRSGSFKKSGFEGGQMPLQRRIPKYGFKNIRRIFYVGINLDVLQNLSNSGKLKDGIVNKKVLIKNGLLQKKDVFKVLARGVLTSKLEVKANKFSKKAYKAIIKIGGKVKKIY